MQAITYCLRNEDASSNCYYEDVSEFTDEVLVTGDNLLHDVIDNYICYQIKNDNGYVCPKEEHCFELLILGTLWQVYSGDATGLEKFPQQLLSGLTGLRKQGGSLKPGIDVIRGVMSTLFLAPDPYDNLVVQEPTLEQMGSLLDWLDATGEFGREIARLRRWREFLKTLSEKEASDILAAALTFDAWFEGCSKEVLGRYTQNVDRYLNEVRPGRYWHEDVIFCGRRRVEYHLNMVGAEVMNRVFSEAFSATSQKVVLVPACMRMHHSSSCKAEGDESSLDCMECTSECSVSRLKILGRAHNFQVLIVPHESSISSAKTEKAFIKPDTGVVGVACVLNLVSGGWLLKDMGIPAQCVLLDYCGCKNHWSREGVPTEINIAQLKRILNF